MISKGKEYDRTNRILIMENMAVMMRMYARTADMKWLDKAKELGAAAKVLSEKIRKHNYYEIDAQYAEVEDMEKRAKKLV